MTTYQEKIIKPRLGLLKLAEELGNVSQACKVMGYSRAETHFTAIKNFTNKVDKKLYMK